jgi:hypothetical protein
MDASNPDQPSDSSQLICQAARFGIYYEGKGRSAARTPAGHQEREKKQKCRITLKSL